MYTTGQRIWDLLTGLIVLFCGIALLVDGLDLFNARRLFIQYWPALLILIGIRTILLGSGIDKELITGLFWVATGALFFLSIGGWLQVPVRNLVLPLLLIWFGVSMLYPSSCDMTTRRNGDAS